MQAVGLKTHIWQNNFRSALLLAGFPFLLIAMIWAACLGLIGGFGVAYLAGLPGWVDDAKEKLWGLVALVSLLLTLYAFGELTYRMFLFKAG